MNLLEEPWLPVRRTDGSRAWVAPTALADPTLVAFDADRPDFNGALAQFAIGLLQTTAPVETNTAWRELFRRPPSAETLAQWFAPVQAVFVLDGDGSRFMQDRTLAPDEGAVNDVSALLIETPGEQTLKNNADHFIKRGQAEAICPHCAAIALLTLQINAPAGGAGHRTGLRGGGPLTTLVACQPPRSLWHDLWLNVREQPGFLDHSGERALTELHYTFPWLADITALQTEKGELAPIQAHPAHVFWATPRRIRLDFEQTISGTCPLCGRTSERLIRQYVTKNYGLNYKGAWDHPLSPYYQNGEDWLPLHPQSGGIGYRHWLGWVLGAATESNKAMRRARVVSHVLASGRGVLEGQLRLWAFGYDMDNMKARCWYEASLPLYGLNECDVDAQKRVEEEVRQWLAGANLAAFFLRSAVKDAWFGADARGDFSVLDACFWSATEADFYRQLRDLIDLARVDGDIDHEAIAQAWLARLRRVALDLFDTQFVGAGAIERQNPRRAAEAYRQLGRNLAGKKIRAALGLPATAKPSTQPADAVNVQP
jgi:CRISPR system Cascade subunit CasA